MNIKIEHDNILDSELSDVLDWHYGQYNKRTEYRAYLQNFELFLEYHETLKSSYNHTKINHHSNEVVFNLVRSDSDYHMLKFTNPELFI